jgi:hypothetical protein
MLKKRMNIISAATCFAFTVVVLLSAPSHVFAAAGGGSTDQVKSEAEPLPYVIIGALVVFAGIIIFDVIFRPYEEKKDDTKKPVHAKVDKPKETKSQPKPKYSTDYDYMLGITAAQTTHQLPVKLTKANLKQ